MWPFLPYNTTRLASAFATIASNDAEASFQLFNVRMYPQSIYHFQQAVEKASKAYGLLAGTVRPTSHDLTHEISHRSILGMMLRAPELMEMGPVLRRVLRKSLNQEKLKAIGVWDMFAPLLRKRESEDPEAARKAIVLAKELDPAKLWKTSLDLDPNHPFTKIVWQGLETADARFAEAEKVEAILSPIRKLLGHPEDLDYMLNMYGRAGPDLFPLTLVSMWHEKETRYPGVEKKDYWNPAEYTQDKGLIKNYSLLHDHTERLCKAMLAASNAVTQHQSEVKRI